MVPQPTPRRRKVRNGSFTPNLDGEDDSLSNNIDAHNTDRDEIVAQLAQFAELVGIPQESASSLHEMQSFIARLQENIDSAPKRVEPRALVIHRVPDSQNKKGSRRSYLDTPSWVQGETSAAYALTGALPISNVEMYLSKHPEVSFIILREYDTSFGPASITDTDGTESFRVNCKSESIVPAEGHLVSAMKRFVHFFEGGEAPTDDDESTNDGNTSSESESSNHSSDSHYYYDEEFCNDWLDGVGSVRFTSPYLSFYHTRGAFMDVFLKSLASTEKSLFKQVTDHIMREYEVEYALVDDLISESRITYEYMHYLYRPGKVVVHGRGAKARGYTCTSWLLSSPMPSTEQGGHQTHVGPINPRGLRTKSEPQTHQPSAPDPTKNYQIEVCHWDFDGRFSTKCQSLTINAINTGDRQPRCISDLELCPLEYLDPKLRQRLQNRGEWVWKCRRQQMIAYRGAGEESHHPFGERHMIDMKTYHKLHPSSDTTARRTQKSDGNSTISWYNNKLLTLDSPPDEDFVYMAPLTMKGFNLKTKKWVDLDIDRFSEVQWNTGAFESLVLQEKTKRLIRALISNQIETEMATDIISGKGNGIIMLLHGGPGTGKTLTAESVAEIAKKPLFPVTCGDIGTEPSAVESYLESVLHLGKTWGCVVLLDEADVFLEQRSLEDLHRNALVSVFLRVLEYYDGILILTSNRVGTFDEAFRSRIQLAIHYTNLTTYQRTKIWENFFKRLKTFNEEGIDFEDLQDHVEELARHKINGREIRNIITTARQSARWERKQENGSGFMLNYKVMEEIIETSGKFDTYIKKLNGGMSQDELAEDEGLRLSKEA